MEPFSDNIIFLDTEFSSLNPYKGEILSVGLIKLDGEELYLELEYQGEIDAWVKKNVLPNFKGPKASRGEARKRIQKFIGRKKPYLISCVGQFDTVYWHKLFGVSSRDAGYCHWIFIDFASILFGSGLDPESYFYADKNNFFKEIGVDYRKYKEHNALNDAKLLREVYLKFFSEWDRVKIKKTG